VQICFNEDSFLGLRGILRFFLIFWFIDDRFEKQSKERFLEALEMKLEIFNEQLLGKGISRSASEDKDEVVVKKELFCLKEEPSNNPFVFSGECIFVYNPGF
jgi:hypothetical protein